ncbi:hypothetical protein EpCFBP13511_01270 [Erwinia persicina]|uniref:Uncharacterized protein n=1 Tax=Erwinia persicina TaxID=55211 RepID=A0A4U3FP46_9GAMM|nr:hypothetical protein EpCFBP13511_01270 [Erwinia persicina]
MTQHALTSVWTTRLTLTVSKSSGFKNGAHCAPFFLPSIHSGANPLPERARTLFQRRRTLKQARRQVYSPPPLRTAEARWRALPHPAPPFPLR